VSGLRLIAAGHTPALRRAVFGGDDDLDPAGRNAARARRVPGRGPWVCAPSRAARETVHELGGTEPLVEPRLTDPDYGTWTGRALEEVDLGEWLTDPAAAPHGGESLAAVIARAGAWLDEQGGRTLTAVAHPTVVRAVLTHALGMAPDGIWRLDVAPLAVCRLADRAGRWHLHL
jgi:broad specificity phosphatase PhoE